MHLDAGVLLHQVDHPHLAPRFGQVDGLDHVAGAVHGDHRRPGGLDGGSGDEPLGDVDHLGVVGECLVELHHRELGVVPGADALVAEHAADLEHPLHPADDESLQVQLECDAQEHGHVEGVVMGDEWPGMSPAGLDVQHRGLDLDEALLVEGAAEAGDDGMADLEGAPGIGVHDEVGVSLTEPGVGVGEAVPLVGHRPHGLRQQLEAVDLHTELALACGHHRAFHTHPVAEVEGTERLERLVADDSLRHEQLDVVAAVAHGDEDELALFAQQHHATGDRYPHLGLDAGLEVAVCGADVGQGVRAVEAVRVRVQARLADTVDLGEALGLLGEEAAPVFVVLVGGRFGLRVGGCLAHKAETVPGRGCRERAKLRW